MTKENIQDPLALIQFMVDNDMLDEQVFFKLHAYSLLGKIRGEL